MTPQNNIQKGGLSMKKIVASVLALCLALSIGCASAQFKMSVFKASKYDLAEADNGDTYITSKDGNCVLLISEASGTIIMACPSVYVLADGSATMALTLICQARIGAQPANADDVLQQLVLTVGDAASAFTGFQEKVGQSEDKLIENVSLFMGAEGMALIGAIAKDKNAEVTLRLVRASGEETISVTDSAKELITALYKAFVKAGGLKQSQEALAAVELAATKAEVLP